MARTFLSRIVYDLDSRRIVDCRLKPWADRFLVWRSALYQDHNPPTLGSTSGFKPQSEEVTPEGFEDSSSAYIERAVQRILRLLYTNMALPAEPVTDLIPIKEDRN